jgi:hypothetical protein
MLRVGGAWRQRHAADDRHRDARRPLTRYRAGIGFDYRTGTGVVLHMLSGLAIDGRMGLTAIERTPEGADALQDATRRAIDTLI